MRADRSVRGDSAPVLYDGSEDGRLLPQLLERLSDRALDRIDMALRFCSVSAAPAAGGPVVIDPDAGTAPLTVGASVGLEAAALRGGL